MPIELRGEPEYDVHLLRYLQKQVGEFKELIDSLKAMRRYIQAPKIKAKLGEFNKELFEHGQRRQTNPYFTLPNEMKNHIWSYLDSPADRLMLALTCKWNMAMFEDLKNQSEQPRTTKRPTKGKASAKTNTSGKPIVPKKPRATPANRLELIPVLQRLQDWMPVRYKLCYTCLRFSPKTARIRLRGRDINWTGKFIDTKAKLAPKDKKSIEWEGYRCPECVRRAEHDLLRSKQAHKETEAIIRETVGFGD